MWALSLRQPYAALCLRGKDFENRSKFTSFKGNCLIHASKKPDPCNDAIIKAAREVHGIELKPEELKCGGIVGVFQLGAYTLKSLSDWYFGYGGYPIEASQILPFFACNGSLGFWQFDDTEYFNLLSQAIGEEHPNPEGLIEFWQHGGQFTLQ